MNFGEKLKAIRSNRGLSQEDLARILGTSKQVISRYETGQRSPKLETTIDYAEKLGFTHASLVDEKLDLQPLSAVRPTTPPTPPAIKRTVQTMRRLNDNGQGKVADYADDLDKSGQYKRTPAKPEPSKVMELPESYFVNKEDIEDQHISHAAAAGRVSQGVYNGVIDEDDIFVRKSDDRPDFDDVIIATGHSMEPEINDGDVLYLRQQPTASTGDIVVVRYDDEVFVKEYTRKSDRLVILKSFNPDYADIKVDLSELDDPGDFRIIALVIDWETPIQQDQLI